MWQQYFSISWSDIRMLWRDLFICLGWIAGISYLLSGVQDTSFDVYNLCRLVKKTWKYRKQTRLSLRLLRAMEQQYVAVYVPAWDEGVIIETMVGNIIEHSEYSRYIIFVGTYPNDPSTQEAVDRIASQHHQVIKVITSNPGPTTKADCLNHLYQAMQEYEAQHHINFDIILMHDAEDQVHPYEMLVLNYLLPRVDAIQMPILPLPTKHTEWVHWVYADEFVIHHMKDIIVREYVSGFVPFAGVGMGFARRTFNILEAEFGLPIFNEGMLTEDYALGKRLHSLGMHVAFVNVILTDDQSPWYRPLVNRPHFVANWAFFPMTFNRSVRQKTRWITGISIQEWERSGWRGDIVDGISIQEWERSGWKGHFWIIENFIKDRKTFVAMAVTLLGYLVFLYMLIFWGEQAGYFPHWLEPVVMPGTLLYLLISFDMVFLITNLLLRCSFVTRVYGPVAGVLSIPRILVANIINGLAAYRAFSQYIDSKLTGEQLRWEKTHHQEGVAKLPADTAQAEKASVSTVELSVNELLALLSHTDIVQVKRGLQSIHAPFPGADQDRVLQACLANLSERSPYDIRACVAEALLALRYDNVNIYAELLKTDHSWVVRASTARAIVESVQHVNFLNACFENVPKEYKLGRAILARSVGNRLSLLRKLTPELQVECLSRTLSDEQLHNPEEDLFRVDRTQSEADGGS